MNKIDMLELKQILLDDIEYESTLGVVSHEWLLSTLIDVKV